MNSTLKVRTPETRTLIDKIKADLKKRAETKAKRMLLGWAIRTVRGKDKRWKLYRIANLEDAGVLLGTYQDRRDANKALEQIAYLPEPRW